MCVVSMIHDYGRQRIDPWKWTKPDTLDIYKELIKKAEEFDTVVGEPDCESPEKTDWIKDIQRQIDEQEAKKSVEDKKLEALKKLQKSVDEAHKRFNKEMDKLTDAKTK